MLKTTALHALHIEQGGRLVDFAGWELPVQYTSINAEHLHTRAAASLFDVSHMGQVQVHPLSGDIADAAAALETLIPASVAGLSQGRQRYGLFTAEGGGVLDDLMFAHHGDHYFLVVNASRTEHDLAHLRTLEGVKITHITDRSLLALQGPRAEEALATLIPEVSDLVFMDSRRLDWNGVAVLVSRSGYTGEDGFEISIPNEHAEDFARQLLSLDWVMLAGLGARDSLRLEAGMPLYGHELSESISPIEADLAWSIPKPRRRGGSREGGFPGAEVILAQLTDGVDRIRVGLRSQSRAIIRDGASVFASSDATEPVATITSGGFGASVDGPIAMAMLPTTCQPGDVVYAEVRNKRLPMTITPLPFITPSYKR